MPRVPPLDAHSAPPAARSALEGIGVSLPARVQAYWPPALQGAQAMARALTTDRLLPEALIRVALLHTAQIVGCPF
ncbi:MAG TPA: hypothetical protein VFB58_11705 [Chloroflexota bacterium]|nr:hypothetical protein [Chloroflexota bacterium]